MPRQRNRSVNFKQLSTLPRVKKIEHVKKIERERTWRVRSDSFSNLEDPTRERTTAIIAIVISH